MFVAILTFKASDEDLEAVREEHRAWLEKHYADGMFLLTGPRVPRTGGVLLAEAESETALSAVLSEDPYFRNGYAEYAITEFTARRVCKELDVLQGR